MSATTESGAGSGAGAGSSPEYQALEKSLAELYEVHDYVFTSEKAEKQARLRGMIDTTVAAVKALEASTPAERAALAFYHGKALDAAEGYQKEAEDQLSVAVKLDPSRIDAWNALGNCLWKKGDLKGAMSCFTGASKQKKNAVSLRQQSMLMRQLGETPTEKLNNIKESVNIATQAVSVDVSDAESWYILGNAFMAKFFSCDHLPEDLTSAMKAYKRADKDGNNRNPDLHFNRANVLMFQEEYDAAVEGFKKAASIDPSLPAGDHVDGIIRHVSRVANLVETKASLKPKKLKALTDSLPVEQLKKHVAESKKADEREFVTLSELKPGANKGKMVVLKLVIAAIRSEHPPWTVVVVDHEAHSAALSLYHLDKEACERLGGKDTLIVLDPVVKMIKLTKDNGSVVSYPCVQVLHPGTFFRNGRSVTGSFAHASVKLATFDN